MTDTITLKEAVGIVLEGFTLPDAARKILETAYFAEADLAQQAEQGLYNYNADPSCTTVELAEMILSDCGCSSNNTSLVSRVANRIDTHMQAEQPAKELTDAKFNVLAITTAYEQGVGKGHQAFKRGNDTENPYKIPSDCAKAWGYGYQEGKVQAKDLANK